jgi:hypothetical protein
MHTDIDDLHSAIIHEPENFMMPVTRDKLRRLAEGIKLLEHLQELQDDFFYEVNAPDFAPEDDEADLTGTTVPAA